MKKKIDVKLYYNTKTRDIEGVASIMREAENTEVKCPSCCKRVYLTEILHCGHCNLHICTECAEYEGKDSPPFCKKCHYRGNDKGSNQ